MLNELTFAEGKTSGIYLVERDPFFREAALRGMLGLPKALGVSGEVKGKKFGIERCRLPKKLPLPSSFLSSTASNHLALYVGTPSYPEDPAELGEERDSSPQEVLLWGSSAIGLSVSEKSVSTKVLRATEHIGEVLSGDGKGRGFIIATHDVPAPGAKPRQKFDQFPHPGVLLLAAKNEREIPEYIRDAVWKEGETSLARQEAELDPLLMKQRKRLMELYPVLKKDWDGTQEKVTTIRRDDFEEIFQIKGSIFGKGHWIQEVSGGPPAGPYSVEEMTGLIAFREQELLSKPASAAPSKEASRPASRRVVSKDEFERSVFDASGSIRWSKRGPGTESASSSRAA